MNIEQCAELLKKQDNILILTHTRPDGDTLGSGAALCSALRRLGKTAKMFNNPEITPKYLKYVKDYISDDASHDFAVAVDTAEEHMLPIGFSGKVNACIDHHPSNSHYADELLLNGAKASCGEIVLEVIKAMCGSVTKQEADLLYMAVSTDCGCFRYANVKADTFAAASELLTLGADLPRLNFDLFRQTTRARLALEGAMLSGMRYYYDNKAVACVVTLDMMAASGATENDCDDIANVPGRAEGCVVSIVLRQIEEKKCKASLRSNATFDSSALCAVFGGGGHRMAAGCTIEADPETALDMLVREIGKSLG